MIGIKSMLRGNVVLVNLSGDYGKPRPCVVLQSNILDALDSVLVAPITSDVNVYIEFRLIMNPTKTNGLMKRSQVMLDKIVAIRKSKIKSTIGKLNQAQLSEVNRKIILIFGIS